MSDSLSCSIVKHHDDGDLTIKCDDTLFVITTEGEMFQEIKEGCECKCDSEDGRLKTIAGFLKGAVKTGRKIAPKLLKYM